MKEIVFKGSSNSIELVISEGGIPINFISGGVTRMEIYLGGTTITSDTSRLNYFDNGVVVLTLGDVESLNTRSKYLIALKIFTNSDPLGLLIIHPSLRNSKLTIDVVKSTF